MSLGFNLKNRLFGDLLNKVGTQPSQGISSDTHDFLQLLCVNEDARANFSVLRGARFFADLWVLLHCSTSRCFADGIAASDWQHVIPLDSLSKSHFPASLRGRNDAE